MTQDDDIDLPGYAPWELPTQRKHMPDDLQAAMSAHNREIRVDQRAYDKHTTGAHPESFVYMRELNELLHQWTHVRPSRQGGNKWEIYVEVNDPAVPWVLVVLGESRGGYNLVSIHLPRAGTVRNRLRQPGVIRREGAREKWPLPRRHPSGVSSKSAGSHSPATAVISQHKYTPGPAPGRFR